MTTEPLSRRKDHLLHTLYYLQVEHAEAPVSPDHPEIKRHDGHGLEALVADGLVERSDQGLTLTEVGIERARDVVRRHRLAERLMADVLGMPPDSGEYIAGEMEHIVTPDLARSICTLLGHPTECPHRNPIPPGACCREGASAVAPAVVSLLEMSAGDTGTIAYIMTRPGPVRGSGRRRWGGPPGRRPRHGGGEEQTGAGGRRIGQMASLGLFPGQAISVLQTSPTYVVRVGGTTLALDSELAACIRVRHGDEDADSSSRQ